MSNFNVNSISVAEWSNILSQYAYTSKEEQTYEVNEETLAVETVEREDGSKERFITLGYRRLTEMEVVDITEEFLSLQKPSFATATRLSAAVKKILAKQESEEDLAAKILHTIPRVVCSKFAKWASKNQCLAQIISLVTLGIFKIVWRFGDRLNEVIEYLEEVKRKLANLQKEISRLTDDDAPVEIDHAELAKKALATGRKVLILPTAEQIKSAKINPEMYTNKIVNREIPIAEEIDITQLNSWYDDMEKGDNPDPIYDQVTEYSGLKVVLLKAQDEKDQFLRLINEVTKKPIYYLTSFGELNNLDRQCITNILKHITHFFHRRREAIATQEKDLKELNSGPSQAIRKAIDSNEYSSPEEKDVAIQAAIKKAIKVETEKLELIQQDYYKLVREILGQNILVALKHCVDNLADAFKTIYFEKINMDPKNSNANDIPNILHNHLLKHRRDAFRTAVRHAATNGFTELDPHDADTLRYYEYRCGKKYGLGARALTGAESSKANYAKGYSIASKTDEIIEDIDKHFEKNYTAPVIIDVTRHLLNKPKANKSNFVKKKKMDTFREKTQHINSNFTFGWLTKKYVFDRSQLLAEDGSWHPAAVAVILRDIGAIQWE